MSDFSHSQRENFRARARASARVCHKLQDMHPELNLTGGEDLTWAEIKSIDDDIQFFEEHPDHLTRLKGILSWGFAPVPPRHDRIL